MGVELIPVVSCTHRVQAAATYCAKFFLTHGIDDVVVEPDVLGGASVTVSTGELEAWFTFLDCGSDTVVFSRGDVISWSSTFDGESLSRVVEEFSCV